MSVRTYATHKFKKQFVFFSNNIMQTCKLLHLHCTLVDSANIYCSESSKKTVAIQVLSYIHRYNRLRPHRSLHSRLCNNPQRIMQN